MWFHDWEGQKNEGGTFRAPKGIEANLFLYSAPRASELDQISGKFVYYFAEEHCKNPIPV